ncbi:hypothetical protein [Embleya sp. NPDC020886]|uniref:hypothetical protein n=1 Tax=Embleya sp. NPDC020886 TaxID=3363980 RepID=UPI0037B2D75F
MDQTNKPDAVRVGEAYPQLRSARALHTALTHEDPDTRAGAAERLRRWQDVVRGMRDGVLDIGSRRPVREFPEWVTPEVVRGGFATGHPAAGGKLRPHEIALAGRIGLPAERGALFAHHLSAAGLAELTALLESGTYDAELPEETALLVVAWLLRTGDTDGALELVEAIAPFADRLRFAPRPTAAPVPDPSDTFRTSVGEAHARIAARPPNPAVAAMREALTVWNPYADALLAHWLETVEAGRVLARTPDTRWAERGHALLARHRVLAAEHPLCTKHRRPKENAAILRTALADHLAGRALDARRLGLLARAIEAMVTRRGAPAGAAHEALRARQTAEAALPTQHALAAVVLRRLAERPQDIGTEDVDALTAPVDPIEASTTGLPAGTAIPPAIRRILEGTLSAPIDTLIERGLVPSAEVLAELVPQLVAASSTRAYPDDALRTLMAAHHRAFGRRRSLLLLDLAHQVRAEELPWVAAVARYRDGAAAEGRGAARRTLVHLGELAVHGFPGTILPNPLVGELSTLSRAAETGLPWVEELAADIFTGRFAPKFLAAAKIAAELLAGSLYEVYYDIDYAAIAELGDVAATRIAPARTAAERFALLCRERADVPAGGRRSPAANGMVIEQAQILTTHNLATLAGPVGITPRAGWAEAAHRAFVTVCRLTEHAEWQMRPLATIKDAAYAWRQVVFHLSMLDEDAEIRALARLDEEIALWGDPVAGRLAPVVFGLRAIAEGDRFDRYEAVGGGRGRRLTGWTTGGHFLRG